MALSMVLVRDDGATLEFELVAEAQAGGNMVIVQTSQDIEPVLQEVIQQPLSFQYYDGVETDPIEFTGKVVRLVSHTYNQGKPQLQIEIQQDPPS